MKYKLVGNTMPAVEILFENAGESVFTQSGGMTCISIHDFGIHKTLKLCNNFNTVS